MAKGVRSVKIPAAVYDRLASAARDLRISPARFLELAMRREGDVRLVVHAQLVEQVTAEYETARRKASPEASATAPPGSPSPASADAASRSRPGPPKSTA